MSFFRGVLRSIPGVEIRLAQYPGRETRYRDEPFDSMASLIEAGLHSVRTLGDAPFAFIGHSFGGIIAFELARALRARFTLEPVHLFVSACQSPDRPWTLPPLRHADENTLLAEVQRRWEGVPSQLMDDPGYRRILARSVRADLAILETHQYSEAAPLACPITALGGLSDHMVPPDFLQGWQKHTTAEFQLHLFAGGHFFVNGAKSEVEQLISRQLSAIVPCRSPQ